MADFDEVIDHRFISRLHHRLHELERVVTIMADNTAALQTAFNALSADFTKFAADVTAQLATIQANAADQATIASITTAIEQMDTQMKALDAQIAPPAPLPPAA